MPRTPTLYLSDRSMRARLLARWKTTVDTAYCKVFNFIESQLGVGAFPDPHPGLAADVVDLVARDQWLGYYASKRKYAVSDKGAQLTEALTHTYDPGSDPPARIGVNEAYHTEGTLVHEFFHFFSHKDFRLGLSKHVEGLTELLARKVLGIAGRADVRGHGDFYAEELKAVSIMDFAAGIQLVVKAMVLGGDAVGQVEKYLARAPKV